MMLNKARQILQKFYGYEDFRPGQKKVVESLLNRNDTVIISISNRISKPVKIVNGMIQTSKSDKENHGIGLNNIMTIVKKYDGDARMRYKDGWFYYTAIL